LIIQNNIKNNNNNNSNNNSNTNDTNNNNNNKNDSPRMMHHVYQPRMPDGSLGFHLDYQTKRTQTIPSFLMNNNNNNSNNNSNNKDEVVTSHQQQPKMVHYDLISEDVRKIIEKIEMKKNVIPLV
jgi:hypothetical protein